MHVRFGQMIFKKIYQWVEKMQILIKVINSDLWQNVNKEIDYFSKLNNVGQNTHLSFFQYDFKSNEYELNCFFFHLSKFSFADCLISKMIKSVMPQPWCVSLYLQGPYREFETTSVGLGSARHVGSVQTVCRPALSPAL